APLRRLLLLRALPRRRPALHQRPPPDGPQPSPAGDHHRRPRSPRCRAPARHRPRLGIGELPRGPQALPVAVSPLLLLLAAVTLLIHLATAVVIWRGSRTIRFLADQPAPLG